MSEERDDIVILVDENGDEVEFEHLDTIDMNGNEYVVLMSMEADQAESEEDSDEVVILKIEHNEEDDSFVTVDNEDELNAVFDEFKRRVEEEYEFVDE